MQPIKITKYSDCLMNVLIANNKKEKTEKLSELLHQLDRNIQIIGNPATIGDALRYLNDNSLKIDLAFFETQLSDGSTFEIFNHRPVPNPVIFTSPTKKDAFEAIKVNGVDYLVEPLTFKDVAIAVEKAKMRNLLSNKLPAELIDLPKNFKKRFIVKFGDKIQHKNVDDISYIFAEGKLAYIVTRSNNRKYIIEHTLDELEKFHLNPDFFFRINRKFIVNIDVIEEVRNYVNSRLKLIINSSADMDMIVSREKVNDFKNWLNI